MPMPTQPQASSANPATALSEAPTAAATVLSCGHSAPHAAEEDVQSYGHNSPRAARSQISTAVSFEGAKPANSAALASRSAEGDSAHSVAEPEGENSSMPPAAPGGAAQPFLEQPTTSLLSTAVRTQSPPPGQPGSPEIYRANSVVSHTETQQAQAARAGTPASVYAQGRVRAGARSPEASQAGEQHSGSEGARRSARSSRRPATGRGSRASEMQTSRAGAAAAAAAAAAASRHASFLAPGSRKRQQPEPPRRVSPAVENNSIEAVERGGSQDGHGGLASAEGPRATQRARRQDSSQAPAQPPRGAAAANGPRAPAPASVLSHAKGAREAADPALQHQNSAVLGSGLLTFLLPQQQQQQQQQAQQQAPGQPPRGQLQTHRSLNAPSVASGPPPRATPPPPHQPQPPPQQQQPAVPGRSGQQDARGAAPPLPPGHPEAHSPPLPQPAMHQELDEGHGPASDAEMTGPSKPAAGGGGGGGAGAGAAREATPSRLAGVSLAPGGAATHSGGSHHRPSSGRLAGGSADAQALGSVPWGEQGADQEPPQPATSVLGTLVADDMVSDIENDTEMRSLQPSARGRLGGRRQPAGSADGAPAIAVATAGMDAAGQPGPSVVHSQPAAHSGRLEAQASAGVGPPAGSSRKADSHQLPNGTASLPAAAAAALLGLPQMSANGQPHGVSELGLQLPHQPPGPAAGEEGAGAGGGLPPLPPSTSERAHSWRQNAPHSARLSRGGAPANSEAAAGDSHASAAAAAAREGSGEGPAGNSACCPASATVRSEGEAAAAGADTVAQSQPQPQGAPASAGPQPALTVVMHGGVLSPSSEQDDGAAGPLGGSEAKRQLPPRSRGSEHSSANGRATSAVTSPSRTPGRSRREASKRKRSASASGPA